MIFSADFYRQELFGVRREMPVTAHGIEELFFKKLIPFQGQPGCFLRWPVSVGMTGVPAHWAGKRYNSKRQQLANLGRDFCRVVAPQWWA